MSKIENSDILMLTGEAKLIENGSWKESLYKEVSKQAPATVPVRLVPYYAWGNRGHSEMSVWLPVSR